MIAKKDTHSKGQIAELLVLYECMKRGYRVSLPFGGHAPYDFILESSGVCHRVQTKKIYRSLTNRASRWMCDFVKPKGSRASFRYEKYTADDCDFVCAVCVEHFAFYVFPIHVITTKKQASFYFNEPVPEKARYLAWTAEYKDAWPT